MTYIRRALLALVLSFGLAPAFAQAPAAVPALPDTERRTSYSITATTCACNVNFALYGDSTDYQNWVEVFIDGVRYDYNDASHGWTITSPSGSLSSLARPITNAVLTFNAVQTGTVQIVGARRPRRTAQFAENTGVSARNLNQVLTDIISQNREIWDKTNDMTGRSLLGLPGESIFTMPAAATRAGKFLYFDSTGLIPQFTTGAAGTGNVVGPASSTVGHVAVWDNTTGTLLRDGGGGFDGNILNSKTANYTLLTTDCGKTIQAGTGSTGFFTITIPATAGFDSACVVNIINGDTASGKGISADPGCSSRSTLWPGQTCKLGIENGAWKVLSRPGRWRAPSSTLNFYTNFSTGSDTAAVADGLSAANPFKTVEGCFLNAADQIDLNTYTQTLIVCNMADSVTDTSGMHVPVHALTGAQGGAAFKIKGGTNSIISTTGVDAVTTYFGTVVQLQDVTLRSDQNGLNALWGSKVYLNNVTFGGGGIVPAGAHIGIAGGAQVEQAGTVTFAGNSAYGIINNSAHYRTLASSFSFSADAAFSGAFLLAVGPSNTSFSGTTISLNAHTITGVRFNVSAGSHVDTGTGAGVLTYFPGDVAGSVSSAGTYDTVMSQTAAQGGTGQISYTTGDLLYASSGTALSKLADVATGNAIISGGVGVAPSYGKIGLTTHVSGTLPVANGGTGTTTVPGIQAAISQTTVTVVVSGINFNSANTDNAIVITLPTGFTRWRYSSAFISNASASLTTATCGIFTATGAGGVALVASGTAITVSTAAENTVNNYMALASASTVQSVNATTVYFRVQTPQGSAATGTVTFSFQPIS